MSNKSRRRVTTSRRRATMAAGVILAGAAIPLAAAGTAWADDDTITVAQAEKDAKAGEQVDISINGKTIKDTCAGACTADSGTKGEHNTAIAIGAGSDATVTDATDSTAKASGGGEALVENKVGTGAALSHDTAHASNGGIAIIENNVGAAALSSHDTAHASNGGIAFIENNGAGALSHDTASASGVSATGTNPAGVPNSYAEIENQTSVGIGKEPVSNDTATATNGGYAVINTDGDSTVAVTHDTAIGNNGAAGVGDAANSKATAVNTGPATITNINGGDLNAFTAGASVTWATDSTAKAEDAGSMAAVSGTTGSYITGSSAVETEGGSTNVFASDTHEVNGMVVPHVEAIPLTDVHVEITPLTEVHVMPSMPLP
jgi:hypothetical protein